MKKKKRIFRTVISTMLLCCMLVGDLGSVFATSIVSDKQDSSKEVQTSVESDNDSTLSNQNEQSSNITDESVIEEPEVEIKPEEENTIEATEVNPDVEHDDNVPVEEPVEPSVETATPSETDNWSLDLVFYDSTVDGGKTPIKSIDWDASNNGYEEGDSRIITVQIHYKNSNAIKTYQPGDLKIELPNLIYGENYKSLKNKYSLDNCSDALWSTSAVVSANDDYHTGFDWDFISGSYPNNSTDLYSFSNNKVLEKGSSFEGTIQVEYTITPSTELKIEEFDEQCIHEFSKNFTAILRSSKSINTIAESNLLMFHYKRIYKHPWMRSSFTFKNNPETIKSLDGFPSNSKEYIWVKYNYSCSSNDYNQFTRYPYIGLKTDSEGNYSYSLVKFPKGCVVYNEELTELKPNKDGLYKIPLYYQERGDSFKNYICVGYPKSTYNDKNNNMLITTNSDLYCFYEDGSELEYITTDSTNINLAEYVFKYDGDLYSIDKYRDYGYLLGNNMRYQDIVLGDGDYNRDRWYSKIGAIYTGEKMTVKFGSDILSIQNKDMEYVKLEDSEYYFSEINIPSTFKNALGNTIKEENYNCELWLRYSNKKDYIKYDDFKLNSQDLKYNFYKEDGVVGYYILVKDLSESIFSSGIQEVVSFSKKEIPEKGYIPSFSYLQVYTKDSEGNLILKNEPTLESYDSILTFKDIAKFDKDTYGVYLQRDVASSRWNYYDNFLGLDLSSYNKLMKDVIQDSENERFTGSLDLGVTVGTLSEYNSLYNEYYSKDSMLYGFEIYDLLPKGFELTSTGSEIINSLTKKNVDGGYSDSYIDFLDENFKKVSHKDVVNLIKKSSNVKVLNNWKNTGRTMIKIVVDLNSNPLYVASTDSNKTGKHLGLVYNIKYAVSFDSCIESAFSFKNYSYSCFTNQPMERKYLYAKYEQDSFLESGKSNHLCYDDGLLDGAVDINDNGINDMFSFYSSPLNINQISSTHQDVQTSVQTDKSNYTTGLVKASPESEYSYKLRARSGSNQVSNLVLVNNLEEGYGENEYWKGKFLGIDTSFAESKTYKVYKPSDQRADVNGYVQEKVKVKPYYSTSTTEGELYQTEEKVITDPSGEQIKQRVRVLDEHGNFVKNSNWLEYSDSVDKNTVKSLAFEFLDAETGEQAILPENNLIYVEVNMKAPVESDGITADGTTKYAYNNCFTQWNALDNMGQTVDFITGINSNTVTVTVNYKMSVKINKIWEDENNKYNTRPKTVEFVLKKNGFEVEKQVLNVEKGESSVSFNNIIKDELESYTFEEICPKGYTTEGVKYNKEDGVYSIVNTLDSIIRIKGTKSWVGDSEAERPLSININLYRDGKKIDSKVVSASDNWEYDFGVFPKKSDNGVEYKYEVLEEPLEGYLPSYSNFYGNGTRIKFSDMSETEGTAYDFVEIYYRYEGSIYKHSVRLGGNNIAGKIIEIPSKEFYIYWRTDRTGNAYYGYKVDEIHGINMSDIPSNDFISELPSVECVDVNSINDLQSQHNPYKNNTKELLRYKCDKGDFSITNTADNIELRFIKEFTDGEELIRLKHSGITFSLYENTLDVGYPKSFPGTSNEWKKVGDLSKSEIGGSTSNFTTEYYIKGLQSNKEYFLVENVSSLVVEDYEFNGDNIASYNVDTVAIKNSCYVVRTGTGNIQDILLTVYGYSNNGDYKPLEEYYSDEDFCDYYGAYIEGTELHSYLEYMSSKYPSLEDYKYVDMVQPVKYNDYFFIQNILDSKKIGVTKKIKASDINFDNGNPTFIFEARLPKGYSLNSSESILNEDFNVFDIKSIEFTKDYVEANTDSDGFVSKTVYFDKVIPSLRVFVVERVSSRYGCSSVTVDGVEIASGILNGMGFAVTNYNNYIETNITFTNDKYENQYYSHNDLVVNKIKRNKTSKEY